MTQLAAQGRRLIRRHRRLLSRSRARRLVGPPVGKEMIKAIVTKATLEFPEGFEWDEGEGRPVYKADTGQEPA